MPALCCAVASCALTRLANQEGLGAEKREEEKQIMLIYTEKKASIIKMNHYNIYKP